MLLREKRKNNLKVGLAILLCCFAASKNNLRFIILATANRSRSLTSWSNPRRRRLVEAMGIEPMSALHQTPSATCLASVESELPPQRRRIATLALSSTAPRIHYCKVYRGSPILLIRMCSPDRHVPHIS